VDGRRLCGARRGTALCHHARHAALRFRSKVLQLSDAAAPPGWCATRRRNRRLGGKVCHLGDTSLSLRSRRLYSGWGGGCGCADRLQSEGTQRPGAPTTTLRFCWRI
jgi:hypothetical protein